MRILYITPCWPHGPSFGGQLRALHLGRALQEMGDVTLAVVSSDAPGIDALREINGEFDLHGHIRVKTQPNVSVAERTSWLLNPRYMNVHGSVANESDCAALLKRLPEFDLIWVLNSRTPNILQQWSWPGAVLDLDDIPSLFHRSVQQTASGFEPRMKAQLNARISRRREKLWRQRFTTLSVCSERDRKYLGGGSEIYVIPNGFPKPISEPRRSPVRPARFGFIGLFNYMPNLEGVRWFIRECWPLIKKEIPDALLRLIGKDTDGELQPVGQDVQGLGWIADPAAEIATWSAMIIPVLHGAGTRVKIADAFSRKCPVVSTPLGAYGYEVKDGRELRLAGNGADFAAACVALARHPEQGQALAENAWHRFLQNWTWESITPRVRAAAEHCLNTNKVNAPLSPSLAHDLNG